MGPAKWHVISPLSSLHSLLLMLRHGRRQLCGNATFLVCACCRPLAVAHGFQLGDGYAAVPTVRGSTMNSRSLQPCRQSEAHKSAVSPAASKELRILPRGADLADTEG